MKSIDKINETFVSSIKDATNREKSLYLYHLHLYLHLRYKLG